MKRYAIIIIILLTFVSAAPIPGDTVTVTITSVERIISKETQTGDPYTDAQLKKLKYKILITEIQNELESGLNGN